MNTAMRAAPGVEIEDDAVRLRRRKLEYEADVARRTGSGRLRTTVTGTAAQAVSKPMAVGSMFSSLIRRPGRRAAVLRSRRPAPIPRIRWYS